MKTLHHLINFFSEIEGYMGDGKKMSKDSLFGNYR